MANQLPLSGKPAKPDPIPRDRAGHCLLSCVRGLCRYQNLDEVALFVIIYQLLVVAVLIQIPRYSMYLLAPLMMPIRSDPCRIQTSEPFNFLTAEPLILI